MVNLSSYECRGQPLAPFGVFLRRIGINAVVVAAFLLFSLAAGTLGYHVWGGCGWVDAYLNAAMILTGMGPVTPMVTTAGKLFSASYALYSGVTFLTLVAFLMAPVYHRVLHHFHLQTEDDEGKDDKGNDDKGGAG